MKSKLGIKDYDFFFKLVLVGDTGVGKTTLLRTFTEACFNTSVRPNDVADVETKTIQLGSKRVKLHVWDTAGMERYRSLTESYYRNTRGCVVMFDVQNEQSFFSATHWLDEVYSYCAEQTRVILVGTKCREPQRREVAYQRAENLANERDIPYMEVGSQQKYNVDQVFENLARSILSDLKLLEMQRRRYIALQSASTQSTVLSKLESRLEFCSEDKCLCG